jgi:hypothetical protein
MNLAEIRNIGAFVSAEPVKHGIEWKEHRFDVFVKRLSFGDIETLYSIEEGSRSARMISTAILLGENQEAITYDDAFRLDVGLATKLIEAFNIVNGLDQKKIA